MNEDQAGVIEMTSDIVAAYVGNNAVTSANLPALIKLVHDALVAAVVGPPEPEPQKSPAVSVRKSVTTDFIICLEDGRPFKSLKRHLRAKYDLTPEQYRTKWGLPKDYPMVAPSYAEARSQMAKKLGLGHGGVSHWR